MAKESILVVDDEQSMRFFLKEALGRDGYQVEVAKDGAEAIQKARAQQFAVIILDIRMPGMSGLEAMQEIRKDQPAAVPIVITAYGSEKVGLAAISEGAYDYFTKPFELAGMRLTVERALEKFRLRGENEALREELGRRYQFSNIVGESGRMMEIYEMISRLAQTNVTVLIYGESGTGKELVARAIHYNGPRRKKPFIKMSCAAIPESLLESELFGHEKGAFTGATERKPGRFELADHGSLFLDEVGEMSPLTQTKLLRVLQEREFERVGGKEPVRVNVRLIAATNRDLPRAVREKQFREDLFYRLNVATMKLPALRERREDIPLLLERFLERYNRELGKKLKHVSVEAMDLFMKYGWPGNVRELENAIQHAMVMEKGDTLTASHLPLCIRSLSEQGPVSEGDEEGGTLKQIVAAKVREVEKRVILTSLKRSGWNRTKTAEVLGMSRKSLHNKMKKYGISKEGTGLSSG